MSDKAIPSAEVVRIIRSEADIVCLSVSGGKDSTASWIVLQDAGFEIVPIYHYDIPDLAFVEENLQRLENHFGTKIIRIPHVRFYQVLGWCAFQPPHRVPILEAFNYQTDFTLEELKHIVLREMGLEDAWIAVGTRAADSTMRKRAFLWHGPIRHSKRTFFPVWDWKKSDVLAALDRRLLPLPVDYSIWNRSFDGIDYFFLKGVRDHFPDDFRRILDWFPLIEAEFFRRKMAHAA